MSVVRRLFVLFNTLKIMATKNFNSCVCGINVNLWDKDTFFHSVPMEEHSRGGNDFYHVCVLVYEMEKNEDGTTYPCKSKKIEFNVTIPSYDNNNLSTILDCVRARLCGYYIQINRITTYLEDNTVIIVLEDSNNINGVK